MPTPILSEKPLCFVDTETGGLHPEQHKIWEFGGVKTINNSEGTHANMHMWFQMEIDLGTADPFALNVGKYWERFGLAGRWMTSNSDPIEINEWRDSPGGVLDPLYWPVKGEVVEPWEGARLIREFTHEATLIGNVIGFDAERMALHMRAYNSIPTWHYHVIDIEPMIVGYAKARGTNFTIPYSSSEISQWLGVEEPTEEERHTALGDALWVERQWNALHEENA